MHIMHVNHVSMQIKLPMQNASIMVFPFTLKIAKHDFFVIADARFIGTSAIHKREKNSRNARRS